MYKVLTLAIASLCSGTLMTQAQAVQPQPLPANIAANVAAVQAACADVRSDTVQLDISRATHDSAGVTANLTTLKSDQATLRTARETLSTSVETYMKPARDAVSVADTAYEAAFTQLRADVIGNPSAVPADKAKVLSAFSTLEAAQDQVQANQQALAGAGAFGRCPGDVGRGNRIGSHSGTGSVGRMGNAGVMGLGRMRQ